MKKLIRKTKGIVRGTPTAVVFSAVIHLILLSVAGGVVIFTAVKKKEAKFTPPPKIDRPKMELRKPRVKVKKTVRPKTSQRIVSKSTHVLPDIQPPEISAKSGLSGGLDGFLMMPDPAEMTLLGGKNSVSIGNDFEGTFYALSLDRQGRRTGLGINWPYYGELRRFLDSGWNPNAFSMYYRSPQKLYTTFFYIPMSASEAVPRSFGIPDEVYTLHWCAHYKGKIKSRKGGKFRFWGRGENVCVVRLNKKIVLVGGHIAASDFMSDWRSTAEEHRKYWRGHGPMGVGDWFELKAGESAEVEVLFGDTGGYWTQCTITIQEYGKEYPLNEDGGPILPVFKTAEIPEHLKDEIKHAMIEGEADLYSDLTFNVY
jgi:hypothetical protein